jgi:hypothetical protein
MIKVEAVWYADTEQQADEMTVLICEKYKVAVSYKTKEVNDDDEEEE